MVVPPLFMNVVRIAHWLAGPTSLRTFQRRQLCHSTRCVYLEVNPPDFSETYSQVSGTAVGGQTCTKLKRRMVAHSGYATIYLIDCIDFHFHPPPILVPLSSGWNTWVSSHTSRGPPPAQSRPTQDQTLLRGASGYKFILLQDFVSRLP